jgi:hypothetical protein
MVAQRGSAMVVDAAREGFELMLEPATVGIR